LAEETGVVRVNGTVFGFGVFDHVEVYYCSDIYVSIFICLRKILCTGESLFFTSEGGEDDGCSRLVVGENAG
jgi:hypothetical protein